MDLAKKIRGGFGLAVGFLLLIGLAVWWSTGRNVEIFGAVAHSHRILHSLESAQRGLFDLDMRARGYFITGNDLYLEQREAAVASVLRLAGELQRLTSDNPAQQSRVAELGPAIEQRLKQMEQYITFRRERGAAEAFRAMSQMKGRIVPDESREIITAMQEEERRVLQERIDSAHAINRKAIGVVLAGSLLAVMLVTRSGFVVRRHFLERQRAEVSLRESKQQLETAVQANQRILDNSLDVICTIDDQDRMVSLSAACGKMWGYPPEELLWRKYTGLVHPEDLPRTARTMAAIQAGLPVREFENRCRRKDGSLVPVAWSASWSPEDKLMFCVAHDLTTRKQVEQIHLQFRALFESLPGLYLVLKPDFTIVAVSDAYLKATMTKREAIMGRGLFDIFPDNPDDPAATGTSNLRASLNRVLLSAAPDTMAIQKYDVRRPDGIFEERFWSPVNSPVFGADQSIEYIIHRVEDVTDFMRQKQSPAPEDSGLRARMEQMEAEVYRSAQEVQAARDQLEQRVKERTAELAKTNRELVAEIAAREQSQLALRAAEAKFRTLVEQSLVGIYVIQDANYVYMNPRMTEIFGFSAEEFGARPVLDFIAPADRPIVAENIRKRLQGEVSSIRYQLRMTRKDETVIHVEAHGARIEFNGRPAILGTLLDITEQKLAEQRLAGERQLLRTLIDNLPSHIFVKDTAGRYLISNRSHTRLLGAKDESELLGKTVFDFFPPDTARAFEAGDRALFGNGESIIEREEPYESDGQRGWSSLTKVPLRDAKNEVIGLVGIKHDITERKQAEEELKFYTASLERSNRELQDFASVASHDLQEPLRKIQAFGDRLKARAGPALDETGRDYLDRMQSAAARMQTLVNDLLTFSRVTSRGQPFAPTDLARVTREVLSDLETRLEQTKGRVDLGNLPVIEADATQMRQLLQNLIANALKFHRPDEPPVVKVFCERDGDFVRLHVADNGIGFEEKYLDRIFTIFQRLHGREAYEGTGVGLAVCRKIVHRHGGNITARSQPGQGATFIVSLPVRQVKESPTA